jgi:hypothetical protein
MLSKERFDVNIQLKSEIEISVEKEIKMLSKEWTDDQLKSFHEYVNAGENLDNYYKDSDDATKFEKHLKHKLDLYEKQLTKPNDEKSKLEHVICTNEQEFENTNKNEDKQNQMLTQL